MTTCVWKSSYGLVQELSEHDWDIVKKTTKNIIGYSDVTYLLCALVSHNVVCYYGPNYNTTLQCSSIEELRTTLDYLSMALDNRSEYTITFSDRRLTFGQYHPWTINEGIATGRLIGGNLDTIVEIVKQGRVDLFSPKIGDVLILEEVDPNYFLFNNVLTGSMIENLMFLKEKGVFSNVDGILFGRSKEPIINDLDSNSFSGERFVEEKEYFQKCIESLELDIPILANAACGHTHPMVTLPLGKQVTLNATEKTITIHND